MTKVRPWVLRGSVLFGALLVVRLVAPLAYGRDARRWFEGDPELVLALCRQQVHFEEQDSRTRQEHPENRYAGEWALVTHQMTALGLAQVVVEHPETRAEFAPVVRTAALRSFLPEMRQFGTRAWHGEDALASLESAHGHAYLAYSALAVSMARWVEPQGFPPDIVRTHDALIAAFERRLLASPTALIETYPGEAYPTDVAAVAAAIAVHGRATGVDHSRVLRHWVQQVRDVQMDRASGYVIQRMSLNGTHQDVARGSGTGLAAYFAGFVDPLLEHQLARALAAHERTFAGFGAVAEFDAQPGQGDIDSGPVILGVSVAATGFSLAPFRACGFGDAFTRLVRTTTLFGLPAHEGERFFFRTGGPIGNALLLAMLTAPRVPRW